MRFVTRINLFGPPKSGFGKGSKFPIYSWGYNSNGEHGRGTFDYALHGITPTPLDKIPQGVVADVFAGNSTSFLLMQDVCQFEGTSLMNSGITLFCRIQFIWPTWNRK